MENNDNLKRIIEKLYINIADMPVIKNKEITREVEKGGGWYCLGRRSKEEHIIYCVHAYSAFDNNGPIPECTADCKFYEELNK